MAHIDSQDLEHARRLYTDGMKAEAVAKEVGKTARTIRNWVKAFEWERFSSPAHKLERKINAILEKPTQSNADLKRLDNFTRNLARIYKGDEKKKDRNALAQSKGNDAPIFFKYQREFLDDTALFRLVRKARQIGWTHTIAWEALEDALERGRDKGFMSASFRQTKQINKYIKRFAREQYGLKLKGSDIIHLPNGADIHFFASNPATAQGFTGDMYFDEFAWLMQARECFENAAAIAALSDYRITIVSTPSVFSHFFEELWDATRTKLDISRHEVNIIDAIEGGNHLINLEKVFALFPARAIPRLFMCETLDDEGSAFTFDEMMACVHDDEALFEPKKGERIRCGVDVSRWRDDTVASVMAQNDTREKPLFDWRYIKRFNRVSLPIQTEAMKALIEEWEPESINIDATQIGEHMCDELEGEFSGVERVKFSATTKAKMVINMQTIVREKRMRIPFEQRVIDSFLAIKQKALEAQVGYQSDGNDEIGHADDFWAIALALLDADGSGDDFFMM